MNNDDNVEGDLKNYANYTAVPEIDICTLADYGETYNSPQ